MIEKGWPGKKIFVIPNFVNSHKNTVNNKNFLNKKTIISMGRFHENKGFDLLIKSLKSLPNYYLWLLGNGEM